MFKKDIMRLLLCGLLSGLLGAMTSLQACSVGLRIQSQQSGAIHSEIYEFALTDGDSAQLFFPMLCARITRCAGVGNTLANLITLQISCTDEERAFLANDGDFQARFFASLEGCCRLRNLILENLGGDWLVRGLLQRPALWLAALTSVFLHKLCLEGAIAELEGLLVRLSGVTILSLGQAGLTDFGPIARCIQQKWRHQLKALFLFCNDFAGQEDLIQQALDQCNDLQTLDLTKCRLQRFPMKLKRGRATSRLQKLFLSENDFSCLTEEELGRFFSQLSSLRELNIWGCNFSSFRFLLQLPNKKSVTLHCGGRNFEGYVAEYMDEIDKSDLFEKIIGMPMAEQRGSCVRAALIDVSHLYVRCPRNVEELDLEGSNCFSMPEVFVSGLSLFARLKKLSLRNCRLQDARLIQSICGAYPQLEDLDVRENLFDDGELLQELATVRKNSLQMTIHADCLDEDRGVVELEKINPRFVSAMTEALMNWLPGVNELRLRACDFGDDEGPIARLFRVLRDAPRLRALRIRDLRLSLRAVGWPHLPHLEVLECADCELAGQGEALKRFCLGAGQLRSLLLTSCGLRSGDFLPKKLLQQLVRLDLSGNPLDQRSLELLMRVMEDCPAMADYKDSSVEFNTRGSRTVLLVREGSVSACAATLERLPAQWRERATELHLPAQSEATVQGPLAELILGEFSNNLKSVWVPKDGEMHRILVSKLRAAVKYAMMGTGSSSEAPSSSAAPSEAAEFDEEEGAHEVDAGGGEGSDPESDDEGMTELCQAFSYLRTTGGASTSAVPAKRGAKKSAKRGETARSSAAASAPVAASSSSRGGVERTEDVYVFNHSGHGELVLSCRTWDGDCGSKNYDISRLPADVIRAHCVGGAVDERVRLNLSEFYDAANPKSNLAHAFEIGAIDWILRHPDTRMFIFRGAGAYKLKTAANYRIAFMLPVRLSWLGKDSRVMAKECFAVVSFGRDGVLHHACYHGGVDFQRYSRVNKGEVIVGFDAGAGRLSFDLDRLWVM